MHLLIDSIKENFFNERSRWFSWAGVLFALGIGVYFGLSFEPPLWATLAAIELLIAAVYFCRFSQNLLFFLAVLAFVVLGFATVQLKANYLHEESPKEIGQRIYISGRVVGFDYNYRGMPRLILSEIKTFEGEEIKGKVRVVLSQKKTNLKLGDCAEMITELKPPLSPPMVGGYEFSRKIFFQGINASGFVMSRAIPIECELKRPVESRFSSFVFELRKSVVERINAVLPKDEASITAAILAGERGMIGERLYNQYRDSGLAHFLSISGLHMSMIAGLMFFLVRLIVVLIPPLALRYDSKKIAAVFAILTSVLYLLISGSEIPAQRAFIMTLIVLIGVLCSRTAISMKTISWAALIVLLISPEALIGPSFQMSFAAVVCLIAFYERWAGALNRFLKSSSSFWMIRVAVVYVGGILAADLVASLATLPFAIYHFNRVAVFTTFGNLLAGPVIGLVIMPFVLVALLLMPFGLEYWPLKVVGFGIDIVNKVTAYVSSMPGAGYQVVSMPMWGLLSIVFGMLWVCFWERRWRNWGWVLVLPGVLSIFMVRLPDVVVNKDGDLFAVKSEAGELVILPSRGNVFDKKMWLEKSASAKLDRKKTELLKKIYKGEAEDKAWVDLSCNDSFCLYKEVIKLNKAGGADIKNKPVDTLKSQGVSLYIKGNEVKVKTVREYVGERFWNGG